MQSEEKAKGLAGLWFALAIGLFAVVAVVSTLVVAAINEVPKTAITLRGPFAQDSVDGSRLLTVTIPDDQLLKCCAFVRSDSAGNEAVSTLRLWINGQEAGPAHTLHDTIRKGGAGFSHWGKDLLFSLPQGVANSEATEIRLEYQLTVSTRLRVVQLVSAVLASILAIVAIWRAGGAAERRKQLFVAAANAALVALVLLTLVVLALQIGLLRRTELASGPFLVDQTIPGSQLKTFNLKNTVVLECCLRAQPDTMESNSSSLRLWINGKEIGPPHTGHVFLREGADGFSHWGDWIYFKLPGDTPNTDQTALKAEYPLKPPPWAFPAILAITATLAFVLHRARVAMWSSYGDILPKIVGAPRATIAFVRANLPAFRKLLIVTGNVALVFFAALALTVLVLQSGVVRRTEVIAGPFVADPTPGSQLVTFGLKNTNVLKCCLRAQSDFTEVNGSSLKLWVNGKRIGSPHTPHNALRGGAVGYSHWGDTIYLTLPAGAPNSNQTVAKVQYPIQPAPWATLGLPLIAGLLAYGLHRRRISAWLDGNTRSLRVFVASPYYILHVFGWIGAAAAVVYAGIVIWGLATGDALPLAIPFRTDFANEVVEAIDPAIPLLLLLLALLGVVVGWAATRSRSTRSILRHKEIATLRWMRRFGLAVMVVFFLASVGASWAGIIRSGTTISIAGLIPFFDAGGYFSDTHTYLQDGAWTEFSSRRPLAAALRTSSFVLGDLRYAKVIAIQTIAMAGAIYFAAMSVMRWRGVWSGIVFIALSYIVVRTHLSTTMTEPLALPIAFVAIAFLVEAIRRHSKWHGLLGLGLLSLALWLRPGPVFAIPALTVWFGWTFGSSLVDKARHFALACAVVIAMLVIDVALGLLFGSGSPGNLAYSLCGLTLAGGWSACIEAFPQRYAEHSQSTGSVIAWLYAQALENIRDNPGPFLHAIFNEPIRFLTETPRILLAGYSNVGVPREFPSFAWLCAIPVLFFLTLRHRSTKAEAPFWILVFAGFVSSATLFYISDGIRAFTIAYAVIGLFVALAFTSPSALRVNSYPSARQELKRGTWAVAGVTALLFALPPLGRLLYATPRIHLQNPVGNNGPVAIVGGMARSTGILVVSDDTPLPHGVPSMHFSRFADVVRQSGAEGSQGIITPKTPPLPFGFTLRPLLSSALGVKLSSGSISLITPPEMVTRRDVEAWEITYSGWNPTGRLYSENWFFVTHAEPYDLKKNLVAPPAR